MCGTRASESLCADCRGELPRMPVMNCPVCAAGSTQGLRCGACLANAPVFDKTVAAFQYRFPLDRLVQSYKFSENLVLTCLFADALAAAIKRDAAAKNESLPDRIVALPLANKRLVERGFNQSAVLAEALAGKLALPYSARGLLKIRDTPPQSGLGRAARLKNIRGAFDCSESLTGQHIAIVDDVMTTGATMSEAARVLKKAGARFVTAWVVARADRLSGAVNGNTAHDDAIEDTIPF